jgi:hypothetical protein
LRVYLNKPSRLKDGQGDIGDGHSLISCAITSALRILVI